MHSAYRLKDIVELTRKFVHSDHFQPCFPMGFMRLSESLSLLPITRILPFSVHAIQYFARTVCIVVPQCHVVNSLTETFLLIRAWTFFSSQHLSTLRPHQSWRAQKIQIFRDISYP